MALFTDGTMSNLEDLRGYESAVYDLASTERIDLTRKLVLAHQELEVELVSRFFRENPNELAYAVVTPALQLWHTFHTLAIVYRDAYNSHLNDRYQGKWREYERQARWALENLLATGVGMVYSPVPKASPPLVSAIPGDAMAAVYWVRAAYVSSNGEEGCASELSVISAPAGSVPSAVVAMAPAGVTGWNVYVGAEAETTLLQNASAIAIGAGWSMPTGGLVQGRASGSGQRPTTYKQYQRVLWRG